MKVATTATLLILVAASAFAASARLVSQRIGTSVSGAPALICTYQYKNQQFERAYPRDATCPFEIEVQ